MLKNINYNLMETITVLSKSLHRYDTYMKDAGDCKQCQDIWTRIADQRKQELSMLMKELKSHMDAGKVKFE